MSDITPTTPLRALEATIALLSSAQRHIVAVERERDEALARVEAAVAQLAEINALCVTHSEASELAALVGTIIDPFWIAQSGLTPHRAPGAAASAFAELVEPLRAWASYIGREIVDGDERHLDPQERNLLTAWRSVEEQIKKGSTP